MIVYISGPYSDGDTLSEDVRIANAAAFFEEAVRLAGLGHTPVNPLALFAHQKGASWAECMRVDLAALLRCDAFTALPGWERSKGARLEVHVARELGLVELLRPAPGEVRTSE